MEKCGRGHPLLKLLGDPLPAACSRSSPAQRVGPAPSWAGRVLQSFSSPSLRLIWLHSDSSFLHAPNSTLPQGLCTVCSLPRAQSPSKADSLNFRPQLNGTSQGGPPPPSLFSVFVVIWHNLQLPVYFFVCTWNDHLGPAPRAPPGQREVCWPRVETPVWDMSRGPVHTDQVNDKTGTVTPSPLSPSLSPGSMESGCGVASLGSAPGSPAPRRGGPPSRTPRWKPGAEQRPGAAQQGRGPTPAGHEARAGRQPGPGAGHPRPPRRTRRA